ncbi:hypothetical protein KA005_46070, partial [bacterium]|nr:hypothetical protein [bacterium]
GTKPKKRKSMSKRAYIFSGIAVIITLILFSVLFFLPTEEGDKSIISLAVLPFTNIKPDPNIDYLGNALAAEIISDLSYFKNISVRPFSTVRDLENLDNLDVDYILTGNFLRVMGDIRLKIELFNTNTNNILWQESLEAEFKKSYKLQDIVSKKVIDELKIQFSSDEQDHMRVDLPRNPQAYEYYLRSLSYSSETNDDSLAIDILKKSIQLDSSYAPAYDELAFRTMRFRQGAFKVASEYGQAEQYFLKALSINNGLITSLNNLSGIYTEIGETEKSMDLVKKALDINPNNAYTHFQLSYNYRYAGMLAESKEEAEIALKIDPNNQRFRSIGNTYLYLREYGKALETYDLDENSVYVLCKKGATFLRNGQRDKALHYFKRAIERNPEGQWGLSSSTAKAYIEGNIKKGLKTNFRWEQAEPFDSESLYNIASNYGLLGEATGCVRMLRKAIEGGFFCYPFLLTDPFLDPVRDDPEFQEVLALAKEKHEAFKKKYFPEEL